MDSKQIKTLVLRCLDLAQERGLATNLCNKLNNFRHKYMSLRFMQKSVHIKTMSTETYIK